MAGLQRAEELRRVARLARLDPVARRRRAGHAGARDRDPVAPRHRTGAPRLPGAAHQPLPRAAGSAAPTGIPTTSCASTTAAPPSGTAGASTNRCSSSDGAPGRLPHDLQHYPYRDISDHLATIDRYTTLAAEQMAADGDDAVDRRGRAPSAVRVSAELPAARRLPERRRRLHRLGAELVLRVSEAGKPGSEDRGRDQTGPRPASSHRPSIPTSILDSAHVLPPHRHRAHLARRTEPGAAHRARPAGARPPRDARGQRRRASCGSARRKGSSWSR